MPAGYASGDTSPMPDRFLEHFRWLYGGNPFDPDAVRERIDGELVLIQDPDVPGTAGTYRGHDGFVAVSTEIAESYDDLVYDPKR